MAFKLIPLEATGSYQSLLVRNLENPITIDLTDTPTFNMPNGVPQTQETIEGYVTGSSKSVIFDAVDDWIYLPAVGGYGDAEQSNIILDNIGSNTQDEGRPSHGVEATNISVDAWIKIEPGVSGLNMSPADLKTSKFFEFTIQRDSGIGGNTEGIDGVYTGRVIYTDDPNAPLQNPPLSAHFVEFLFASTDLVAWSLSSENSLESTAGDWLGQPSGGATGWNHVALVYEGGSAPDNGGDTSIAPNDTKMKMYINGVKDREETIFDLDNSLYDASADYPTKVFPSTYYDQKSWAGRLDELRLMTATSVDDAYVQLCARGNIGRNFDTFSPLENPEISDYFTPTGNHVVAFWRMDSVSAIDLFSGTPQSILDETSYNHHGTPQYFEGSITFASDEVVYMGLSASGNNSSIGGSTVDHSGQVLITPLNDTIRIDSGTRNIVEVINNTWTSNGADATVIPEEKNIYFGSSAVRVNTTQPLGGVIHDISSPYLFHENDYTMQLKLLHLSGSTSAAIRFTLGDAANTLSTTAVMKRGIWEPVYLTHKNDDPTALQTAEIEVLSLGVTDQGSLFLIDGLHVWQGRDPVYFSIPSTIRYAGQTNWQIRD